MRSNERGPSTPRKLESMMSKLQTKKPANLIEKLDMEDVSFKQRVLHRLAANPREIIRAPE